jgi:hypothetical protein
MKTKYYHFTLFLLTLLICLFGVYAGFSISLKNYQNINSCPTIGIVPACYVVTAGYLLMLAGTLIKSQFVFVSGFLPVFLLALAGTGMEILNHHVCPQNAGGTPMCYYSLALVVLVGLSFYSYMKIKSKLKRTRIFMK